MYKQETESKTQIQSNANCDKSLNDNLYIVTTDNNNLKINYFLPGPSQEADKRANTKKIQQLQEELKDVFTGIGW